MMWRNKLFVSFRNKSSRTRLSDSIVRRSYSNRPNWLQHRPAVFGTFTQDKPSLCNPFVEDTFAQTLLATYLPKEANQAIRSDLRRFGDRIVNEIEPLGLQCEQHPPRLEQVDAWGAPVNRLHVSDAWKKQKRIVAEESLIRIGYQRPFDHFR